MEPAETHAAVRTCLQKGDSSRCFELIVEGELAALVSIKGRPLVAKDDSADFARLAPRVIRLAVAEIVERTNDTFRELDVVAGANPARIGVERFPFAID